MAMKLQIKGKPVILDKSTSSAKWVDAQKLFRNSGGIASNLAIDDLISDRGNNGVSWTGPRWFWTGNVLAYTAIGEPFRSGIDVVDKNGTFVLPASSVPAHAVGIPNVGLFIYPENVIENTGRVIIEATPKNIVVLTNFITEVDGWGRADRSTAVPVRDDEGLVEAGEKRLLSRISGQGVRPIARAVCSFSTDKFTVHAGFEQKSDLMALSIYFDTSEFTKEGRKSLERLKRQLLSLHRT